MEGTLLLQAAIVAKLRADNVVAEMLTPAGGDEPAIFDKGSGRPEVFPCVIVGESQTVAADTNMGPVSAWPHRVAMVFITVHVWSRAASGTAGGLAETKRIGIAVEKALHGDVAIYEGHKPRALYFENDRYMRDPDGITGHGVLTFRCLLIERQT